MDLFFSILGVLAVPLLVLINAMFVAAEFALVSVRHARGRNGQVAPSRLFGGPQGSGSSG